ncbi:hypothetical protein CspeluHIS016_0901150 [Cutaneotrichosporon spelunceum]|uniref:Protein-S-isoprenylcysteine O-methyltransferase n=1 Tax=Cutaneotrichosporon spelunceum TaxID=1672016 RepID=A0AAD3U011_9TREE|nr:hypothetical protein CspeluHIS016_0901150 [Cutaneotrichosporon spelunceum]
MSFLETRVPPPALAILSGYSIKVLAERLPEYTYDVPNRPYVAGGIAAVGLIINLKAIFDFRQHKTTISPFAPNKSSTVVRDGVYGLTRNPMYLSLCFGLTAWGVWKKAPLGVGVIALFMLYMTRFQIIPEERALEANFGEEFTSYKKAVRRWI